MYFFYWSLCCKKYYMHFSNVMEEKKHTQASSQTLVQYSITTTAMHLKDSHLEPFLVVFFFFSLIHVAKNKPYYVARLIIIGSWAIVYGYYKDRVHNSYWTSQITSIRKNVIVVSKGGQSNWFCYLR